MDKTQKRFKNVPNYLTFFRILSIPLIMYFLYFSSSENDFLAAIIFILGSITDLLDGYIARKYKIESVLGKLLDPLADKIMVSAALVMLCYLNRVHPWLVILLLCREFAITGLRSVAAGYNIIIQADIWGKLKTNLQCYGIIGLILNCKIKLFGISLDLYQFGYAVFILSLTLAIYSMINYFVQFFKQFRVCESSSDGTV